jgi:nitrite reductase (NADH) small subunit/3-phenylpropionate/trans-cinnamate dioxygenase ferredoxin subunit
MGRLSSLGEGEALEKQILARRVAVFRSGGKLYGLEASCKHMGASLGSSPVENGVVTCRWHGWKYRIDSGECLTTPGVTLKTYDVEVDGDDIYVIMQW